MKYFYCSILLPIVLFLLPIVLLLTSKIGQNLKKIVFKSYKEFLKPFQDITKNLLGDVQKAMIKMLRFTLFGFHKIPYKPK